MYPHESLHGAGFRLIISDASARKGGGTAEFFGPPGQLESQCFSVTSGERDGDSRIEWSDWEGLQRLARKPIGEVAENDEPARITPVRVYMRLCDQQGAAAKPVPEEIERLRRLADALLIPRPQGTTETQGIPAGYTYFGQFLAHELSFLRFCRSIDGIVQTRNAALDLETILNPSPEFAKAEHAGVTQGESVLIGKTTGGCALDVPREDRTGRPLLYDERNDSNLALAQVQVMISRFVREARRLLREDGLKDPDVATTEILRHFQSAVLHDYLPKLVDCATWQDVLNKGRACIAASRFSGGVFHVPIEVAAAIFRFGHSMLRTSYQPWHQDQSIGENDLMRYTYYGYDALSQRLQVGRLPDIWTMQWQNMMDGLGGGVVNKASKIDTELSVTLLRLPRRLFQEFAFDPPPMSETDKINLAFRTLALGHVLGLPSAQDLAAMTNRKLSARNGPAVPVLNPNQVQLPNNPAVSQIMRERVNGVCLTEHTPLWLYVLREAEALANGERLGPLAGRFVAETLSAAVEASGTGLVKDGVIRRFACHKALDPKMSDKFTIRRMIELAGTQ